jgi:organic hydroperoxide reductase OsmC/OhrA
VAKNEGVALGQHTLDADVDLIRDAPSFKIAVTLTLTAPGVDRVTAERLLGLAHQVCPYSKATRGNVDVTLKVA